MVLAGRTDAFEPLVTPYRGPVLALAYRLTRDREVAREVEDAIARDNAGKPVEEHRLMTEDAVRAALPAALRDQVAITFEHKLRSQKA